MIIKNLIRFTAAASLIATATTSAIAVNYTGFANVNSAGGNWTAINPTIGPLSGAVGNVAPGSDFIFFKIRLNTYLDSDLIISQLFHTGGPGNIFPINGAAYVADGGLAPSSISLLPHTAGDASPGDLQAAIFNFSPTQLATGGVSATLVVAYDAGTIVDAGGLLTGVRVAGQTIAPFGPIGPLTEITTSVPDVGSAALLFGVGLLGLAALRRGLGKA